MALNMGMFCLLTVGMGADQQAIEKYERSLLMLKRGKSKRKKTPGQSKQATHDLSSSTHKRTKATSPPVSKRTVPLEATTVPSIPEFRTTRSANYIPRIYFPGFVKSYDCHPLDSKDIEVVNVLGDGNFHYYVVMLDLWRLKRIHDSLLSINAFRRGVWEGMKYQGYTRRNITVWC